MTTAIQRPTFARAEKLAHPAHRLLAVPILLALVIAPPVLPAQPGGKSDPTPRLFAPYVDMSLTSAEDLAAIQKRTGLRAVTLAFLSSAGGHCAVGWEGLKQALPNDKLPNGASVQELVRALHRSGVQVILALGGQSGTEPALVCRSQPALESLYRSLMDRYGVTMLDFDIEGKGATDRASIDRRNQALAALQQSNPALRVTYTLEAMPTGLVDSGLNLLASAARAGLAVDVVNLMAMDYGSAVDHRAAMGSYAIQAASAAQKQLQTAGIKSAIGITVMIGANDEKPEVFTAADAQAVLDFARKNANVKQLSIWSLARDNGHCPGRKSAAADCSGIQQRDFEFSTTFAHF